MVRRFCFAAGIAAIAAASALVACTDEAEPTSQASAATDPRTAPTPATDDGGKPADGGARKSRPTNRLVAIGIDPLGPSYLTDLASARAAGVKGQTLTYGWDQIEVAAGPDAGADAGPTVLDQPALGRANGALTADDHVVLAILAFDRGGPRIPADLAGKNLDDPAVITRYAATVKYAVRQLHGARIEALLVAADVDEVVVGDDARSAAFTRFLRAVSILMGNIEAGLPVGFSTTLDGAVAKRDKLTPLWKYAGIVGIDYVAVDAPCQVRAPSRAATDFDALFAAVPASQQVLVHRLSYPSGACGGTPESQAAFVGATFGAWDAHASALPILGLLELNDATASRAAATAQREKLEGARAEALSSTGLRSEAGRPKAAFDALKKATADRTGWL